MTTNRATSISQAAGTTVQTMSLLLPYQPSSGTTVMTMSLLLPYQPSSGDDSSDDVTPTPVSAKQRGRQFRRCHSYSRISQAAGTTVQTMSLLLPYQPSSGDDSSDDVTPTPVSAKQRGRQFRRCHSYSRISQAAGTTVQTMSLLLPYQPSSGDDSSDDVTPTPVSAKQRGRQFRRCHSYFLISQAAGTTVQTMSLLLPYQPSSGDDSSDDVTPTPVSAKKRGRQFRRCHSYSRISQAAGTTVQTMSLLLPYQPSSGDDSSDDVTPTSVSAKQRGRQFRRCHSYSRISQAAGTTVQTMSLLLPYQPSSGDDSSDDVTPTPVSAKQRGRQFRRCHSYSRISQAAGTTVQTMSLLLPYQPSSGDDSSDDVTPTPVSAKQRGRQFR